MIPRLVVAVGLVVVAVVVANIVQRRRRTDPPAQPGWEVPSQLDRADFPRPDAPWLVAVFSSATCATCASMVAKATVLDSPQVVVADVEVGAQPALHQRYRIDAVPITVVADAAGVVHASFVGPATATDLWAAVAEARQPGSRPAGGCQ